MLLKRLLTALLLVLSITRPELEVGQRYTLTGSAFGATTYTAQLELPQGFTVVSQPVITSTQLITQGATFHWLVEVTPDARRNIPLTVNLVVNGQRYAMTTRVNGRSVFLPLMLR